MILNGDISSGPEAASGLHTRAAQPKPRISPLQVAKGAVILPFLFPVAAGLTCYRFLTRDQKTFGNSLKHHFNPLHFYCRLKDLGVLPREAKAVSSVYGKLYEFKAPSYKEIRAAFASLVGRVGAVFRPEASPVVPSNACSLPQLHS